MIFKQVNNKNMYISTDGNVLKSYNKIIAVKKGGQIYLNDDYHDFSKTTATHRNLFLGVGAKEFKQNVKNGRYHFLGDEEIVKMCYGVG